MVLLARMQRPSARMSTLWIPAILFVLFLIYAHRVPWQDPGSVFFDPERAYRPRYSAQRQHQAESFISRTADTSKTDVVSNRSAPSMCIGVPTISRPGAAYLPATVGSLLDSLTLMERSQVLLYVLIADTDPGSHPFYNETWLHSLVDKVLTYDDEATKAEVDRLKALEQAEEGFREKALFDYTYLLQRCLETGAAYVAILEDDVIAAEHWYAKASKSLTFLEERDWLYLRLFNTEAFLGWNIEDWPSHTFWSIGFILALVIAARLLHARSSYLREEFSPRATTLFAALYATALVILFFTSDRMAVWPLSTGTVEMRKYGCCAQGLVFPRDKIGGLVQWFEQSHAGLVDVLTEQYANERNMARWALSPSVLQHIGAKSSKGSDIGNWGRSDDKRIWSFAFEDGRF